MMKFRSEDRQLTDVNKSGGEHCFSAVFLLPCALPCLYLISGEAHHDGTSIMDNPYRIRTVIATGGERLPMLIRRVDGAPLFDPTVFVLSQVRGRSHAAATVDRYLRAIMHLLVFAEVEGIDLDLRIRTGRLLSPHELDALVEAAGRPLQSMVGSLQVRPGDLNTVRPFDAGISLERRRAKLMTGKHVSVDPQSAGTRLRAIRDYLKWLSDRVAGKATDNRDIEFRRNATARLVDGINARLPAVRGNGRNDLPEGLPKEQLKRIFDVLDPDSQDNPWMDRHVRVRNQLILQWLYGLGLRRGELLALRISDIQAGPQMASVRRRPDSRIDPRRREALVKTKGRDLPISELFQSTEHYILDIRRATGASAKHPFLFVAARSGLPLSHSGLTKVFQQLKAASGVDVSAHLLRHSWNDNFSELMDREKVPEATEKKVRSYLQGWKETSNTAAVYTRRHVREKAKVQLLKMQQNIFKSCE